MKIKLILAILLLIATPSFATTETAFYKLLVPDEGSMDWNSAISKDMVSIDTIIQILSQDSAKVKFISNDISGLKTVDITHNTKLQILTDDAVIQDTKITNTSSDVGTLKPIISNTSSDVVILKITSSNMSTDVANLKTKDLIISSDVGVLKVVSNNMSGDVGALKTLYNSNSIIKGWAVIDMVGGVPAYLDSYNTSGGAVDTGTGLITINWDIDFANRNYCVVSTVSQDTAEGHYGCEVSDKSTGSTTIHTFGFDGSPADITGGVDVIAMGDQ